jgi:hypothetical protein
MIMRNIIILFITIALCIASTLAIKPKLVGGISSVDLSDKSSQTYLDLVELSKFGLSYVLSGLNSNSFDIRLLSATQQIVSGVKYTVDAVATQNNCESDCSNLSCRFIIWSQPWLKQEPIKILEGSKCE